MQIIQPDLEDCPLCADIPSQTKRISPLCVDFHSQTFGRLSRVCRPLQTYGRLSSICRPSQPDSWEIMVAGEIVQHAESFTAGLLEDCSACADLCSQTWMMSDVCGSSQSACGRSYGDVMKPALICEFQSKF